MKIRIAIVIPFVLALLWPSLANAGYNEERLIFVNMTPDAKTTALSGECVQQVKSYLGAENEYGDLVVEKMGETKLRRRAGVPKGGLPFTQWTLAHTRRIDPGAAIVLVDCRPEEKHFDVLIKGFQNGLVRVRVRELELTAQRLLSIRQVLLEHLWAYYAV
tara:strand:+ start:16802 stop:17284 length:483 start_codon:yes stop_codon:yes gene_type:complete